MSRPPSLQSLSGGPSRVPADVGACIRLDNGLDLVLVHAEDGVGIFRANAEGSTWHQMWTAHIDRPGLYIRVGDWPRGPKAFFDADEAILSALAAHFIAENIYDLDEIAPSTAEVA